MYAKIRQALLATSVMLACTTASQAADLALKAVKAPVGPAYSWTGFYAGLNFGYGVSDNKMSSSSVVVLPTSGEFGNVSSSTDSIDPRGVIGGAQIGYNWQLGPSWLIGVETDFQGAGQKDSFTSSILANAGGVAQATTTTTQNKVDWFGTVRARTGAVVGNTLLYATGGFAYGRVEASQTISRVPGAAGSGSYTGFGAASGTKGGWTIGAGAETKLAGNWTAKLEYLYVDLGSLQNNYSNVLTSGGAIGSALTNYTTSTQFHDHIIRAGVNYAFGG